MMATRVRRKTKVVWDGTRRTKLRFRRQDFVQICTFIRNYTALPNNGVCREVKEGENLIWRIQQISPTLFQLESDFPDIISYALTLFGKSRNYEPNRDPADRTRVLQILHTK